MEINDFLKLKVGDKVRIISKLPESYNPCLATWDFDWTPEMNKWLGKVMTIGETNFNSLVGPIVYMQEDKGDKFSNFGWCWHANMIAEKIESKNQTIVIKQDGLTVTAYCGDKKGVAHCNPDDEFDLYTGAKLALDRAFGREEKPKKPKNPNGLTVICTESKRPDFTKGKVYVRNLAGNLYDDDHCVWSLSCMFDDPTKWTISDARFEVYEG